MRDRYAHLRANLEVHRAMTAARDVIAWCRECERHHADASGLCPVCQPPGRRPTSPPTEADSAEEIAA